MASNGEIAEAPLRQNGGGFEDSPAVRRQQEMLLEHQKMMQKQLLQQQQLHQRQRQQQRKQKNEALVNPESSHAVEAEKRNGVAYSPTVAAFSLPPSVNGGSTSNVTNLHRFMESVTPFIPARSEVNARTSTTREVDSQPFFYLEDLWESFDEWSAFGVGVPLVLNGKEQVEQYYAPSLSGIQLYIDSSKPYSPLGGDTEESNAESFSLTSNGGGSNSKGVGRAKSDLNLNMQLLNKLSLGNKSDKSSATSGADITNGSSASSGADITNSQGSPSFQFLEPEQPYGRRPLSDKISILASDFPLLNKCRSCDLLPSSWICVAWYPIYRIPAGSILKEIQASFLVFHSLSTQPNSDNPPQFHAANTRKVRGFTDPTAKISLPVIGLASYKLKGSPIGPRVPYECYQADSLFQAAGDWLKRRQVQLPDYQFFCGHRKWQGPGFGCPF